MIDPHAQPDPEATEPEIRVERAGVPASHVPVTGQAEIVIPAAPGVPALPAVAVPPPPPESPGTDRTVFMPPIDIYDSEQGLVLLADLPGVTIESLEIQVQDNRLTLFGRVTPQIPPQAQLLHQEFQWGDFLRSFILSDEVDHDRITAKLNNGVLEVVLPRAPKATPRKIQVNRD